MTAAWRNRPAFGGTREGGRLEFMTRKASVVIEQDGHGYHAWRPELEGCQTQGETVEETLVNVREAPELFLETLTDKRFSRPPSRFMPKAPRLTAAEAEAKPRGDSRTRKQSGRFSRRSRKPPRSRSRPVCKSRKLA